MGLCEIWGVKQTGPGRACNVCLEEPRALVCALDLASADWAGPVFPGHRVARGKGRDAPLAYFWPSVSSGCSAGSVLRNTAAPPLTHPYTLHPATITFMFLAQAQAAHIIVHWYKWKQKHLCTKNIHRHSNSPAGFICVNRSLPELCSQPASQHLHFLFVFSGLKPQLPCSSLCSSPTLSLAIVIPVSVILSPFWHVALQKMAC